MAPRTPMAVPRAQPTHFVAPPRTLMPSALPLMASPTHQSAPSQYWSSPMPLMTSFTPAMEQSINFNTPNGAYIGQPSQWTAPTTLMDSTISQTGQDTHTRIPDTPVRPSTNRVNPWPSPSSSTDSPHGNTRSAQSGINDDALIQQIGDYIPAEGPQGFMSDDGIWNEELRVGGPQLCALPATTIWFDEGSHYHRLAWDEEFLSRIYKIIYHFNIEPLEAMLVTRQSQWGILPEPIVTVLIFAKRRNMNDSWVMCAQKIRMYLTMIEEPHISVEIADPRAFPFKGPAFTLPMSPA
ncbi:hypothetical protein N7486_011426 [Penicillium sp. IBT 16267x]|nr:hypothetical protein N7486_011426 [Penicillium sp. IBT 16267x]